MKLKLIKRRYLFAVIGLVVLGAVVGTAYAVTSGNPGNGPTAGNGESAIRDFLVTRLAADGRSDLAPAAGARVSTLATTADGAEWSLSTYLNNAGQTCFSQSIPDQGRGYSCSLRTAIFANGPLYVSWGSRQLPGGDPTAWDQAWVLGFAAAPITAVELVSTDCTVTKLSLNADGAFQTVIGQSKMHNGAWPYILRGLRADGSLVAQDQADLQQPNARGVPIKAPAPASSCS